MASFTFIAPAKCINSPQDLESFSKSTTYQEILRFVQACAEGVVGIPNNAENLVLLSLINRFVEFMNDLHELVGEIPPMKQPMRFGNKSFRTWHSRLAEEKIHLFLVDILPPTLLEAGVELAPYLLDMFGNPTRIDYGTGHELNFILFFIALHKLDLLKAEDLPALITKGFTAYIRLMRRLQTDYLLEPAGSHGVWGLDDYHCLLFLFGAAQLTKNVEEIKPSSIHDSAILQEYSQQFIYLEGISFILKLKKGAPFGETSPMLNDISRMGEWARVCSGLMKLFQGEVLQKLPVIQHIVFGSLIPCTWK